METLKIEIDLEKKDNLLHPFNNNSLNKELVNFLYEECVGHPKHEKIEILIKSEERFTKNEQLKTINLIHSYFAKEIDEEILIKKITQPYFITILGIGLFLTFFAFLTGNSFLKEIFLILGWLAIWEVVSHFLFEERKKRLRLKRYYLLSRCDISFDNVE